MNRPFRLRGFTLLEIIISVSIIVLLAGITVPMTATIMRAARKDATAKRLDAIGKATYQYFEDTMTFPTALTDLNADNGVAGWAGPYMLDYFYASNPESKDFGLDDFGSPIRFGTPTPTSTTIVSLGADHTENTADDIVQSVNVLPVLRSVTQANVDTLNAAITAYNRNRTDTTPALPSNLNSAFNTLVSEGYLPNDSALKFDAWGDALVPTSSSGSPLVAVTSENLEAGSSTNSSGSAGGNPAGGTAKGKGKGSGGKGSKKGSGSSGKGKKSGGNSGGSTPGTGNASGSGNGSSNSSPGSNNSNKKGSKGKGKGKSKGSAGNGDSQQNEDSGGDHSEGDHDDSGADSNDHEDDDHGDSSAGENSESGHGDSHGGDSSHEGDSQDHGNSNGGDSSHGGDSQDHGNSNGSNPSSGGTGSDSGSSNGSNTQSGNDDDNGGSSGSNSKSKKSGGGGSEKKSGKTKGSGKKSSGS